MANVRNMGSVATLGTKSITANGTYNASSDNLDGFSQVSVNVPEAVLGTKSITANGTYNASSDNLDGFSQVSVNVPEAVLGTKSITANGTYNASSDNLDGFSQVSVNVESSGVVLSGTSLPSNNIGNNEDLYVQYEDVSQDYQYKIVATFRKVNGSWVPYVDPEPAHSGYHIWTLSIGGTDASINLQKGYMNNGQWVNTGNVITLDYHDADPEVIYDNIVGISYGSTYWRATAKTTLTDGTNTYNANDAIRAWKYNTYVDITVYKP